MKTNKEPTHLEQKQNKSNAADRTAAGEPLHMWGTDTSHSDGGTMKNLRKQGDH